MNNSVLPQNSLIRGAIGRNVTKKNIGRWQKKNKNTSIYNKYMKNIKNIYSSFASTMSNNNATTINGTNEAESIYSSPESSIREDSEEESGGEFSKLIRRYKAEGQNSSFGSFATRRLKKSRRSGGGRRRVHSTKRRRRTSSKK